MAELVRTSNRAKFPSSPIGRKIELYVYLPERYEPRCQSYIAWPSIQPYENIPLSPDRVVECSRDKHNITRWATWLGKQDMYIIPATWSKFVLNFAPWPGTDGRVFLLPLVDIVYYLVLVQYIKAGKYKMDRNSLVHSSVLGNYFSIQFRISWSRKTETEQMRQPSTISNWLYVFSPPIDVTLWTSL